MTKKKKRDLKQPVVPKELLAEEAAKDTAQLMAAPVKYPGKLRVLALTKTKEPVVEGFYGIQAEHGLKVALIPQQFTQSRAVADRLVERWNAWEAGGYIPTLIQSLEELRSQVANLQTRLTSVQAKIKDLVQKQQQPLAILGAAEVEHDGDRLDSGYTASSSAGDPHDVLHRLPLGVQLQ